MREIKFRGKLLKTGKWVYGDLLTSPNGLLTYIVEKRKTNKYYLENSEPIAVDPKTIGQFTGLPDKNGKEIYEGDIVRKPANNVNELCDYVVCWNDFAWFSTVAKETKGYLNHYPSLRSGEFWYEIWYKDIEVEVIGNIYENPEFLNGGHE